MNSRPVSNGPTATSAQIATGIGVVGVAGLLWWVWEYVTMALIATAGVGSLAAAVWLLEPDSPDPVNRFVASLLAAPATLGMLGGLLGLVVLLLGSLFPVPTGAGVPTALLTIIATVGVVLGCVIAVLGLATTLRDVLTPAPLARFTRSALVCASVPLVVGAGLAAGSVLFQSGTRPGGQPLLSQVRTAMLSPGSIHLHLGSFLLVVAVASGSVWLLAMLLPYEDALADAGVPPRGRARVEHGRTANTVVALAASVLFPVAMYAEVTTSPADLRQLLGSALFDLLQSVTTLVILRYLLVGIALLAVGVAVATVAARVVYGRSATTEEWVVPAAAGTVITVVAMLFAASIYRRVVEETAASLPDAVAARFVDLTRSVRLSYGEPAVVVVALGVLTLLAAGLAYSIRGAISFGFLSSSGGGYSLASTGLLFGTISAGALGSPIWLVFGGVLATVLVWDIGHYGVGLGRTIAPGPSRSAEVVHAGASALVGLVGTVLAALAWLVFQDWAPDPSPARLLALFALIVGLAALVVAARQ